MSAAGTGRWVDEPPLPEITPPPPHLIAVRGAQLLRVLNVDAPNPASREGHTDTVALAWARVPDGGWAALLAWVGAWQQGGRTTGRARWGWCRILQDRTRAAPAPPRLEDDDDPDDWHGQHPDSEFAKAVQQAALTLSEGLREAALTPLKGEGAEEP